jgi:hypothetical protein
MIAAALALAALCALVLISPAAGISWRPGPLPGLAGRYGANRILSAAVDAAAGLEGIPVALCAVAGGGVLVGTREPDALWRLDSGGAARRLCDLAGAPAGLAALPDGGAIVGILERGLFWFGADGAETGRLGGTGGQPLHYPAAIAISESGSIAVADASSRFVRGFPDDLLDGRPNGRLIVLDREGGLLANVHGLYFPAGLAWTGPASLMVAETFRYRLRRIAFGAKTGPAITVLAENLPFMPYAIAPLGNGLFVVPGTPRSAMADRVQGAPRIVKKLMALLPARVMSAGATAKSSRYGLAAIFDGDGRVCGTMHDPDGTVFGVSATAAAGGVLYLGSFYERTLRRLPLGAVPHDRA